jgi:toxin-antitoxin system PIN domain toxin
VILVDANLLLYSHIQDYPQHVAARNWLDSCLNGTIRVGLPWPSLLAFVRIASNPRIFEKPLTVGSAWNQVASWLALAPVWTPQPTPRHQTVLGGLLANATFKANLVSDAHLAALAIEHGLRLCSSDDDFGRFAGLTWTNPLTEPSGGGG